MKLTTDKNGEILLEEVYSGVGLKTRDGEFMGICMRDTGFEFNYQGTWYEAKQGIVRKLDSSEPDMEILREKICIIIHYMENMLEYDYEPWENLKATKLYDKSQEYIDSVSNLINEWIINGKRAFYLKYKIK